MAVFFTVLCGMAALSLGYFISFFATGHLVQSTNAVIEAQHRVIKATSMPKAGVDGDYLYMIVNVGEEFPQDLVEIRKFTTDMVVFEYLKNNRHYAAKLYNGGSQKLLIGFDITDIARDFDFMHLMGILSIIFVMIVVFISYIISVFVSRSTNQIATTAQEIITTGDLSRRLDVASRWDDLSHMAMVLNSLLDRIQDLMRGVRQVSDNIAHDLRTPLTRMRNQIETLETKYGHSDYKDLKAEADHLLTTFGALLRISRLETEQQKSHFNTLDIEKLIKDVIEFYEPLADDKNIKLSAQTISSEINGDKDLLFQAYANIIDNAIKYTPEGGKIYITIKHDKSGLTITVQDSGNGVGEDEIDKLFNRFYRGEKSRKGNSTGLGLSLVKAVIELHGGKISAQNLYPGFQIITIL